MSKNLVIEILKYLNVKTLLKKHFKFIFLTLSTLGLFLGLFYIIYKQELMQKKQEEIAKNVEETKMAVSTEMQRVDYVFTSNEKIKAILDKSKYKNNIFFSSISLERVQEGDSFYYKGKLKRMAGYNQSHNAVDFDLHNKVVKMQGELIYSKELSKFIQDKALSYYDHCAVINLADLRAFDEKHLQSSFVFADIKNNRKFCGNFESKITFMIGCAIPDRAKKDAIALAILSFTDNIPENINNIEDLQIFCSKKEIEIEHDYCLNSKECSRTKVMQKWEEEFLKEMKKATKEFIKSVVN